MTDTTKTPEQLATEAAQATKTAAEKKEADKQAKANAAAEKKAKTDKEKADKKAAKDAEKAEAKAKKDADTKAKADAKANSAAAKEANKMPIQNDVRRPKADGACGKVWALADSLSAAMGQPVPIANLSKEASAAGINDSTIRTQYALWRKFNGVTGRVVAPAAAPAAGAAAAA